MEQFQLDTQKNLVRLIYFDEACTNASEPIVVVASVIVHGDNQMPRINANVRQLLTRLPVKKRPFFEFKADRMFRHIKKFKTESRYAEPMKGFLSLIRDFKLPIEYCAVDRNGFNRIRAAQPEMIQLSIESLAFITCLTRVGNWLRGNAPTEAGLCISDKSASDETRHQVVKFLREQGVHVANNPFDQIVDTIYFSDSKRSIGIQLADYANFFIKMHLLGHKEAEPFYEIIEPSLDGVQSLVLFGARSKN